MKGRKESKREKAPRSEIAIGGAALTSSRKVSHGNHLVVNIARTTTEATLPTLLEHSARAFRLITRRIMPLHHGYNLFRITVLACIELPADPARADGNAARVLRSTGSAERGVNGRVTRLHPLYSATSDIICNDREGNARSRARAYRFEEARVFVAIA